MLGSRRTFPYAIGSSQSDWEAITIPLIARISSHSRLIHLNLASTDSDLSTWNTQGMACRAALWNVSFSIHVQLLDPDQFLYPLRVSFSPETPCNGTREAETACVRYPESLLSAWTSEWSLTDQFLINSLSSRLFSARIQVWQRTNSEFCARGSRKAYYI